MTSINEKMGFRRPGKRAFMANLPKTRAAAVQITAATCPHCQMTGKAAASRTLGEGWLFCTWCGKTFEAPV